MQDKEFEDKVKRIDSVIVHYLLTISLSFITTMIVLKLRGLL